MMDPKSHGLDGLGFDYRYSHSVEVAKFSPHATLTLSVVTMSFYQLTLILPTYFSDWSSTRPQTLTFINETDWLFCYW